MIVRSCLAQQPDSLIQFDVPTTLIKERFFADIAGIEVAVWEVGELNRGRPGFGVRLTIGQGINDAGIRIMFSPDEVRKMVDDLTKLLSVGADQAFMRATYLKVESLDNLTLIKRWEWGNRVEAKETYQLYFASTEDNRSRTPNGSEIKALTNVLIKAAEYVKELQGSVAVDEPETTVDSPAFTRTFNGTGLLNTQPFTIAAPWSVSWKSEGTIISLFAFDANDPSACIANFSNSIF